MYVFINIDTNRMNKKLLSKCNNEQSFYGFIFKYFKQVCEFNWIAEPELSILFNVTFIIFICVIFPQSVSSIQASTMAFLSGHLPNQTKIYRTKSN